MVLSRYVCCVEKRVNAVIGDVYFIFTIDCWLCEVRREGKQLSAAQEIIREAVLGNRGRGKGLLAILFLHQSSIIRWTTPDALCSKAPVSHLYFDWKVTLGARLFAFFPRAVITPTKGL